MIDDYAYQHAPWTIMVPVKPSRFVPLRPEHAQFNIETDLASIPVFGGMLEVPAPSSLLHCDVQLSVSAPVSRRLGSGRSGFYRGRYLKGVGRTPLAQNWPMPAERRYAHGALAVSGAVREFVVSCFLRAKGRLDLVNPCDGVLVAPLADMLRNRVARGYGPADRLPPCDEAMQAVAVKRARFARFTNVAWLFQADPAVRVGWLADSILLLARHLDVDARVERSEVGPSSLSTRLVRAIDRAVDNLLDLWVLGVRAESPLNNLTIDGRFHDLEDAAFVGGRYFGTLLLRDESPRTWTCPGRSPAAVYGLTSALYLHEARAFVRLLLSNLRLYGELDSRMPPLERDFVAQLVGAIEERVFDETVLFSRGRFVDKHLARFRAHCDVDGRRADGLRLLLEHAYNVVERGTPKALEPASFALSPCPLRIARGVDAWARDAPHALDIVRVSKEALDEASFMNELLRSIEAATDQDELLAKLAACEGQIDRHCGATTTSSDRASRATR